MPPSTVHEPASPAIARFALAVLTLLLMLPNLIWLGYAHDAMVWLSAIVFPAILFVLIFAVLGGRLWLACLLLAPMALLSPLEAYHVALYRHPTTPEILAIIVASNPREMREYLGPMLVPVVAATIIGLGIALVAAWLCRRHGLRWQGKSRRWTLAILLGAPVLTAVLAAFAGNGGGAQRPHSLRALLSSLAIGIEPGWPFGLVQRIIDYRQEWQAMHADAKRLESFRFGAHRTGAGAGRQIYVLVIGESSRRDRWQLFGYDRPTNPELARIANLILLPHVISAWPQSMNAIPLLLTRKPVSMSGPYFAEASILRAMAEAGFQTWWISNQAPIGRFDSPVSFYAFEAQHEVFVNHASWTAPGGYDEDLLKPLQHALTASDHDLFIVLHLMGSHLIYDYRYPASFRRFRPVFSDTTSPVAAGVRFGNSYDNTILYTDHVLAQAIGLLQASRSTAALWFVSDHGEALSTPTCSRVGHGIGTEHEYPVPALFWYSDAYAAAFPERVRDLRGNAERKALSADTFESLVDMAGITFPGHDETRSLFSPKWRFRTRAVIALSGPLDFDHSGRDDDCGRIVPLRSN